MRGRCQSSSNAVLITGETGAKDSPRCQRGESQRAALPLQHQTESEGHRCKRESERKEEKFGLLLLSSYLYAEDNTVTNQNPGSWHSNSHKSQSESCLTIQAPAVMNS